MAAVSRNVSITGSTFFVGATDAIKRLRFGQILILHREPTNKYDKHAIGVHLTAFHDGKLVPLHQLGYLPRGVAAQLAPVMDGGIEIKAVRARTALEGVLTLEWDDGK